ncbi:MAG: hypothetical protein JKY48_07285 [Flavobacteriales bacterium]|nr:hypothetical protein [Flavobacteriales bacterium]
MKIVYRLLFSISLIILYSLNLNAQETIIRGSISNQEGTSLSDVTIVTKNQFYAISDKNGSFILRIPQNPSSVSLSISRLGCQSIDTTILIDKEFISLDIVMQEKVYELDPVSVNSDYFNIIEEANKIVLDFTIINNKLIFLYKEKQNQKLGLFNLNGDLIQEQLIPSYYKFKQIVISCTGTILIIGRQECREYFLNNMQLDFLNSFSRKKYDNILQPCIAKINETLYFKRYRDHNKVVNYSASTDQSLNSIITITDSGALKFAHDYFLDILIAYTDAARENYTSPNQRKNHYNYVKGDEIFNLHLINDNLWDGNMLKLMIDRRTDRMVQQYMHIESRPIQAEEFVVDSILYIINHTDKTLLYFNTNTNTIKEIPFNGISWETKYQIIIDKQTGKNYLMNSNSLGKITLDIINLEDSYSSLEKIATLSLNRDKKSKIHIHDSTLYYITHGNRFKSQELH